MDSMLHDTALVLPNETDSMSDAGDSPESDRYQSANRVDVHGFIPSAGLAVNFARRARRVAIAPCSDLISVSRTTILSRRFSMSSSMIVVSRVVESINSQG